MGISRERPKSASYLRLKNFQGTTIGNIWRIIFFSKKVLGKKTLHNAEKPKKKSFRLFKRFLQTENFKKFKGVLFDKIRNFSKKSRIVLKNPKSDIRVHRQALFAQSATLCFQYLGFHDHTFNRAKLANYVICPGFHGFRRGFQ